MAEYGYSYDVAKKGQLADNSEFIIDSFSAETDIGFGLPLKRGTDKERQVDAWATTIDVPVCGISVYTQRAENSLDGSGAEYKEKTTVNVLRSGRIWVLVSVDVVAADKAYVAKDTGLFTNVDAENLQIGKFLTTATANNLAILEIHLVG